MKLNILKKLSLIVGISSLLLFTGCSDQATFEDSEINVKIAVCNENIPTWTTIVKDDVVLGDEGAVLQFDHDSNNIKKVCTTIENTAHIIRLGV